MEEADAVGVMRAGESRRYSRYENLFLAEFPKHPMKNGECCQNSSFRGRKRAKERLFRSLFGEESKKKESFAAERADGVVLNLEFVLS
jgi:hypothetical protein